MTSRVEYGRQIDCAANGCSHPHSDDGEVYRWDESWGGPPPLGQPVLVNRHKARWVQREISAWHPVASDPKENQ